MQGGNYITPTPHLEAKKGDIAESVLMPGDPLRAKWIAESFLDNVVLYNQVRGMLGYSGTYKGTRISIQGSGMGVPSMGIYSYELFNFYDVKNIIRVGSAGGINMDLQLKDIVIALGACTDSNYAAQYNLSGTFAPVASYNLLEAAVSIAKSKNARYKVGNVLCSDTFYGEDKTSMSKWQKMGVLAVEMESAALYMNAANLGKHALCIASISDMIFRDESLSSIDRQTSFSSMIEIALETLVKLEND